MCLDFSIHVKTPGTVVCACNPSKKQAGRLMEQTREPEINAQKYGYLTFDKGVEKKYSGKKPILFNKQFWENWTSTGGRMKLDPHFLLVCTKFNKKCIKD